MSAQLRLSDGSFVIVDAEDLERLQAFRWTRHKRNRPHRWDGVLKRYIALTEEILGERFGKYPTWHRNENLDDFREVNLFSDPNATPARLHAIKHYAQYAKAVAKKHPHRTFSLPKSSAVNDDEYAKIYARASSQ